MIETVDSNTDLWLQKQGLWDVVPTSTGRQYSTDILLKQQKLLIAVLPLASMSVTLASRTGFLWQRHHFCIVIITLSLWVEKLTSSGSS